MSNICNLPEAQAPPEIVVFGSCMIDLICYAPRLPRSGETIHGSEFHQGYGGKGANQCVAAAKLGSSTALVARVGKDSFGWNYKEHLASVGVNVQHVMLTDGVSTGMAQITVSQQGENSIVIVAGANSKLSLEDAEYAKDLMMASKVVIFQFETPISATVGVLEMLQYKGGPCTIVNGAPAVKHIDLTKIFKLCDIFCVNETEAEELIGEKVRGVEEGMTAVSRLLSYGCRAVIVTLGEDGAVFSTSNMSSPRHVSTSRITPLDTTGAGDAFIGALGFFTCRGGELELEERVRRACVVASASVMRKGTQDSFPLPSQLPKELFARLSSALVSSPQPSSSPPIPPV